MYVYKIAYVVTYTLHSHPLQQLCDTLMPYLTTEVQVKIYRNTVVTLLDFPTSTVKDTRVRFFSQLLLSVFGV